MLLIFLSFFIRKIRKKTGSALCRYYCCWWSYWLNVDSFHWPLTMKANHHWRTRSTWHILEGLLLVQILIAQLQKSITSYRLSLQDSRLYSPPVHLEDLVQSSFKLLCNKQSFCLIPVSRSGTKIIAQAGDGLIVQQLGTLQCSWRHWFPLIAYDTDEKNTLF